jgi:hypothetical protein
VLDAGIISVRSCARHMTDQVRSSSLMLRISGAGGESPRARGRARRQRHLAWPVNEIDVNHLWVALVGIAEVASHGLGIRQSHCPASSAASRGGDRLRLRTLVQEKRTEEDGDDLVNHAP